MTPKKHSSILEKIDALEKEVRSEIQKEAQQSEWNRKTQAISDRLMILGAWVNDTMHGREEGCSRSLVTRIKKAWLSGRQ